MARRLAPTGDVVGLRVRRHRAEDPLEVVGVVADVAPLDPGAAVEPEIYWPNQQAPRWATFVVVRTETAPSRVLEPIRATLERLEPDMGVRGIETFDQLLGQRLVGPRFHMALLGGFALVALILALGGTYGVLADGVLRRLPEMGLRMSLGASRGQILSLVLRQGLKPIAIGLALGLVGAFALTRLLSS
ncbi:MAG: FtsX-like permease family protein, partial [Acidobacteriota bacterium]